MAFKQQAQQFEILGCRQVNTCLVFTPEVSATPLDSVQLTFILVLTFLGTASESDHYAWDLQILYANILLTKNEIVILLDAPVVRLNAPVFPTCHSIRESEYDISHTVTQGDPKSFKGRHKPGEINGSPPAEEGRCLGLLGVPLLCMPGSRCP